MLKNAIIRFDTDVTAWIHQWPTWIHTPTIVITNAGQPVIMALIAIGFGLWALQKSQFKIAFAFAGALAAMGLGSLLKHFIHRPRPDTLYVSEMYFKTSSFPSGHALSAAVVCGLLAYLAWKYLHGTWRIGVPIGLLLFALLVGVSRVVVGAHYPSDVLAGWLLGAIFAGLIILIFKP